MQPCKMERVTGLSMHYTLAQVFEIITAHVCVFAQYIVNHVHVETVE